MYCFSLCTSRIDTNTNRWCTTGTALRNEEITQKEPISEYQEHKICPYTGATKVEMGKNDYAIPFDTSLHCHRQGATTTRQRNACFWWFSSTWLAALITVGWDKERRSAAPVPTGLESAIFSYADSGHAAGRRAKQRRRPWRIRWRSSNSGSRELCRFFVARHQSVYCLRYRSREKVCLFSLKISE